MANKNNKPDWNLSVLQKSTGRTGRVGVAWNQDDGSISIALNPCIILTPDKDMVLRLFPNDYKEYEKKKPSAKKKEGDGDRPPIQQEESFFDFHDEPGEPAVQPPDEIPF